MKAVERLVRLYPSQWRARYGEEFLAMLERQPVTLAVFLNVLAGAADARLHFPALSKNPSVKGMGHMQKTCSRGLIAFLCFLLPCALFNAMLDDSPVPPVMRGNMAFGLPYDIFIAGVLLAGLAVFAGGLIVLYGVFRWAAAQKRGDVLLRLFAPALLLAVFVAVVYVLNWTFESALPGWLRGGVNQCLGALYLFFSGASVYSALQRAKESWGKARLFGRETDLYRLGVVFSIPAAVFMAVSTAAAIVWGFMANTYIPGILHGGDLGIFQSGTMVMYVCAVCVMFVSTAASAAMAVRGAKYLKTKS